MKLKKNTKKIFYLLLVFIAIFITISMILYPNATFQGATYGLNIWITILIPSLFPFYIIADILIELGIVNFLGILMEPLMRPLFKLPGEAGFVAAMGFTSGFPMGAILTNRILEKNLCTKEEASRLIAFTNNSSPLFLLVAVPVGIFKNADLGIILAFSHYTANILLGILLGFKKRKERNFTTKDKYNKIFQRSFEALLEKKNISLGSLMGNAINKAIKTILMVGGFVIFFAVFIEILKAQNSFYLLNKFFQKLLLIIGFNTSLNEALSYGFFEMTLGIKKAAEANTCLFQQVITASFLMGWSGLSIIAQVSSIAAEKKVPLNYYLSGRIFQGFAAAFLTGILYLFSTKIQPVFNILPLFNISLKNNNLNIIIYQMLGILALLFIFVLISLIIYLLKNIKIKLTT